MISSNELASASGFLLSVYQYFPILDTNLGLKPILNKVGEFEKLTQSDGEFFYSYLFQFVSGR